jgi:site-specific recombinase XerC
MAKARTGTLVWRKSGWFVRLTIDVDGEAIRQWVDLNSTNEAVARRKKARLAQQSTSSSEAVAPDEVARAFETYAEAATRIRAQRRKEGVRDVKSEEIRDHLYLVPAIGKRDIRDIRAGDINAILEQAADAGKSHRTLTHIRSAANTVFDALWRDEVIAENPIAKVRVPKRARDKRERAVLTDAELAMYVAWQHPDEQHRKAVLQRQVMSIMSRTFGGVRAGDLHALEWTALDIEAFAFGWAPRKKTARPQKLEIPAVLRPFIRTWWQLAGEPQSGLEFPALRLGVKRLRAGEEVGEGAKIGVSHAKALRRDLERAFAAAAERGAAEAPTPGSARWRELFEHTSHTKRVDFHSWRRAYNQALADADVNAQQAAALAGHADLGAHMLYLQNTSKMRSAPDDALPKLLPRAAIVSVVDDSISATPGIWRARRDSNPRPSDPKSDALSS